MTAEDILKDIKARRFKPVYLLHGEESFYIDQIVSLLEQEVLTEAEKGFNQSILYGKECDMSAILNTAKRYPMMSEYQLVLVKEAQELKWPKDDKEMDYALQYFDKPLMSTILVLAYKHGNFDKRKKLYKSISKSGLVFQSDPVKDYKLADWITQFIQQKGYKIEVQAAIMMAEYLGTDLSKISNEVEKLTLNTPANVMINTDLVQRNIGISKEYNVFELQKALASRNALKSNQIIQYFANNPKANPMPLVMASLNNYFTKVLKYQYLSDKSQAASALGVHPYVVKDYEMAARSFPVSKLFEVIHTLRVYDLKSKGLDNTGNTSDGELLKEMVFKIIH